MGRTSPYYFYFIIIGVEVNLRCILNRLVLRPLALFFHRYFYSSRLHPPPRLWYTNKNECVVPAGLYFRQEWEVFMKQFVKMLAAIVSLGAGFLALLLLLDREQEDKYISIYDTDEDSEEL